MVYANNWPRSKTCPSDVITQTSGQLGGNLLGSCNIINNALFCKGSDKKLFLFYLFFSLFSATKKLFGFNLDFSDVVWDLLLLERHQGLILFDGYRLDDVIPVT
jgi:hypothetical protein